MLLPLMAFSDKVGEHSKLQVIKIENGHHLRSDGERLLTKISQLFL